MVRNIIDETKDTFGSSSVDRNIGESIDAGKRQDGLPNRVNDILNREPGDPLHEGRGGWKAESRGVEGFKVGEDTDDHDLAARKQP